MPCGWWSTWQEPKEQSTWKSTPGTSVRTSKKSKQAQDNVLLQECWRTILWMFLQSSPSSSLSSPTASTISFPIFWELVVARERWKFFERKTNSEKWQDNRLKIMTFSYLLIYREIDFTYYDIARFAKAVQSHSYFHQCYNSIPNCWQSRNSFSLSFCVPLACSFSFLVRSGVRGQSSLLWLLFLPDQWTMLLVDLSASVKKGSYSLAFGCPRNKKG